MVKFKLSFSFDMASSPGQSLEQESIISRSTEAGISVKFVAVRWKFMEEIHPNSDNEVTFWM